MRHLLLFAVALSALSAHAEPIRDNSFLIEEAYNQEPGVIQHIQTWSRFRDGRWLYFFTEEWPAGSQRHQVSATIPVLEKSGGGGGLGDVALNYRYQALGISGGAVAFAPRLSAVLATGSEREGTGNGGNGLLTNFPLSIELGSRFVTHWNAGATWFPSARDELGNEAETFSWLAGVGTVYLVAEKVNFLLEAVYTRDESVVGDSRTERSSTTLLNPGVRFAIDRPSGLQIVPGISFPIGVGQSDGERAVLLYLSFEHPLRAPSR